MEGQSSDLWQLQGIEWEIQQHEKGNKNYKQQPGWNEEYSIWNKNMLEGIIRRLDEAEYQISKLEEKVEKNTQVEQQNEKGLKKIWGWLKGTLGQHEM